MNSVAPDKRCIADLALFGGPPLFSTPRPIGQLDAPPVDEYLALLRQVMVNRRLTNDGPMVQELETRLAAWHGVAHCVALASAGLGLMMLTQIFAEGRRGEIVMPAFTFRGLPHFAAWAGQTPRFADVDPITHTLTPQAVATAIGEHTTSILAVCNCQSPGDIAGLCAVAERHQLPIFFDSVYGLGSNYAGRRLGGFGRAEVFSLHASKLLNGFEGGYITTNDADLARLVRYQRNFCYGSDDDETAGRVIGLNAKLNELHAAMALLSLDRIDASIAANRERYETYVTACADIQGLRLLAYPEPAVAPSGYPLVIVELLPSWPLDRERMIALLRAEGAIIGPYYSPPLHRREGAPTPTPSLPVTEDLARRFIQLPCGSLVSAADIDAIAGLLRFVAAHGAEIAARKDAGRAP